MEAHRVAQEISKNAEKAGTDITDAQWQQVIDATDLSGYETIKAVKPFDVSESSSYDYVVEEAAGRMLRVEYEVKADKRLLVLMNVGFGGMLLFTIVLLIYVDRRISRPFVRMSDYANELAKRGFVVLAFDPSYHGYSGGEPRYTGSTDIYAEDFSAGVDYLGTLGYVDREKIGAIGICGSGGFALSAAAADARIKAIATSVMYDIASFGNGATGDARQESLKNLAQARWDEVDNGPTVNFSYPEEPIEEVPAELTGTAAEFYSFYATRRGWHPNALGNVTATSDMSLMNFPSLTHISEISPRPILFVAGEIAHSLGFSETAYANASEPKELYLVPDAMHIDLYDDVTKIPFDKLESFFKENLG
ncbi:MAG: alpha/beta hydrolase [Blautia sp.]|nr:alpha/beta hydrolase [Blautia sp.]